MAAQGLQLSQKRQAGGPGENVLSTGTDASPVPVGASGVKPRPRTPHTQTSRPLAPWGLYFDTTLFQYKQSRQTPVPVRGA